MWVPIFRHNRLLAFQIDALEPKMTQPYPSLGALLRSFFLVFLSLDLFAVSVFAGGFTFPLIQNFESGSGTALPGWSFGGNDAEIVDIINTGGIFASDGNKEVQLTSNAGSKTGLLVFETPIDSTEGFRIQFDYFMGGGNGADGLTCFLLDGSTTTVTAGAFGGSLGYAGGGADAGVPNAYIGVGFDRFGNFTSSSVGSGGPGAAANSIVLRGSGNTTTGYNYITHKSISTASGGSRSTLEDRWTKVILTIRSNTVMSMDMSWDGGNTSYRVFESIDLTAQSGQVAKPATFKFGFSGSTGGSTNYHFIDNILVTQPLFELPANLTLNEDFGSSSVTLTPIETDPITFSITSSDTSVVSTGATAGNTISLNSVLNATGTAQITVTATSGSVTEVQTFTVTVNPVNDAPNIIVTSDIWESVGPKAFSASTTQWFSLVFNSSNTPYAAFRDVGNSNKTTIRKFDGTNWAAVGSGVSDAIGEYVSLAFDSNDRPYVAFKDSGQSHKGSVMMFDGTNWVVVGNKGFAGILTATFMSLDFDSSDTPYVAFTNYDGQSNKTTVMKFDPITDGGIWVDVGTSLLGDGSTNYSSLKIGSNDIPYVAFNDSSVSNKARVMKLENGDWADVGAVGLSEAGVTHISLALDSGNNPTIAYKDDSQGGGGKATVMKFDGTNWVLVGTQGFSDDAAPYISLALASDNTPYVAYEDDGNNSKATVLKFDGANWVIVGTKAFSDGSAQYISLALDATGKPYIAFRDGANSKRATVMNLVPGDLDVTIFENQSVALTVPVTDIDGDTPLAFVLDGGADSTKFSINSSGILSFISPPDFESATDVGADNLYDVIVKASDPAGLFATASVAITVADTNDPPDLSAIQDISVNEDFGTTTVTFVATDPEGDTISYTATSSNSGVVSVGAIAGNTLTLSSILDASGMATITVTATATGGTDAQTFTVTVNPVNDLPEITNPHSLGENWEVAGAKAFSGGVASHTSLVINSSDTPYVAFVDGSLSDKVSVMKFDGTTWVAVGDLGFSAWASDDVRLALDSGQTLYVLYSDGSLSDKATVMKYDGTNWVSVGSTGFSSGAVEHTSLKNLIFIEIP
jgi:hypothetical protein